MPAKLIVTVTSLSEMLDKVKVYTNPVDELLSSIVAATVPLLVNAVIAEPSTSVDVVETLMLTVGIAVTTVTGTLAVLLLPAASVAVTSAV